jgi:5'-nucleotidase
VRGLEFKDEVETANALVPELKKKGVNAIVVLVHEGGFPPSGAAYNYTCDNKTAISGPIVAIAEDLDPEIDMVISGHTHQPYVCNIPDPDGADRLVTSASSFGRLYTETNLQYDRRTQDIVRGSVAGSNLIVSRDVPKNAWQTELIQKYQTLVEPIASEVIGSITADVTRTANAAGESPLGKLIADAQVNDESAVGPYATPVIAFMNPGGIRSDLVYDNQSYGEAPGEVTYGEAFAVQPFNNYVVSLTLTGEQIYGVLNEQFKTTSGTARKLILQVSAGFTYEHTGTAVVAGSAELNGTPIDPAASYRVVANSFLADGGDQFPTFRSGTDVFFGGLDIDAFGSYLMANSPYNPASTPDRITLVP